MTRYSLKQYKDLCRLVSREDEIIRKKQTMLYQMNVFGLKSTSIVQIGNSSYQPDKTAERIIRYGEIEDEIKDSQRIIDLILKTTKQIDPSFRIHVIDTYLILDCWGRQRYPANEAERYDYDRRVFKKEMDEAIEKALSRKETVACLNGIRNLAERNDRQDYLKILSESGER